MFISFKPKIIIFFLSYLTRYSLIILIFSFKNSLCQNLDIEYLKKNTFNITNLINKKVSDSSNILNHDAYFLGENHDAVNVHKKELEIIKLLKSKVNRIILEVPVSFYYRFNYLFELPSVDTMPEYFHYASGNARDEYTLRYLYRENCKSDSSNRYKITAIDYVPNESFSVDVFLYKFVKRLKTRQVKIGYRYLTAIKNDTIKYANEDSALVKYVAFRNNFYANLPTYKKYLKHSFDEVQKYIDGIYIYNLVKKEDTIFQAKTNTREEFMLKNIMAEIKKDSIKKFISINGSYHIPLIQDESWDFMKGWEPLATKFKKNNPTLKVCSIYFMDIKEDDMAEDYFPTEKKLILENTKEGETYLIRLDGEDTPFKELSKKFQYIVVW